MRNFFFDEEGELIIFGETHDKKRRITFCTASNLLLYCITGADTRRGVKEIYPPLKKNLRKAQIKHFDHIFRAM